MCWVVYVRVCGLIALCIKLIVNAHRLCFCSVVLVITSKNFAAFQFMFLCCNCFHIIWYRKEIWKVESKVVLLRRPKRISL
jgi:hypothetical protein